LRDDRLVISSAPPHIPDMVRIAISQVAFDAIASTMALGSVGFENARASSNEVYVWLDHATVAKLRHLRGPGGTLSDAIIRLAEDAAAER
jgi:hypothetical protein